MHTKYFLAIFIPLFCLSTFLEAQQDFTYSDNELKKLYNEYKKPKDNKNNIYIHPTTFRKIMQPIFSNYVVGFNGYAQSNTAASLQIATEEKKASFCYAQFFNTSILSVSANSNIKEKEGTLFSDGKFQGGYGAEITYSWRPTSYLRYKKTDKKVLELRRRAFFMILDKKIAYYTNAEYKAAAEKNVLDATENAKKCTDLKNCEEVYKTLESAQDEVAKFINVSNKKDSLIAWINKYEIEQAKFTGYSFWLLEAKLGYRYEKLNTIDTTYTLLYQQPGKKYFDRKKLSIAVNHIRSRTYYSWLLTPLGIEYNYKTNLDDASAITYTDSRTQDSANVTRTFKDDYTAFDISTSGYHQFGNIKFYSGGQVFLGKSKMFGLRLFGDLGFNIGSISSTKTGILGGGMGLLFSGVEKTTDESKVVASLDFRVEDINGVTAKSINLKTGEKTKTSERLSIKLTMGIPLNRLINTKAKS